MQTIDEHGITVEDLVKIVQQYADDLQDEEPYATNSIEAAFNTASGISYIGF